jgi:hypothetical protein
LGKTALRSLRIGGCIGAQVHLAPWGHVGGKGLEQLGLYEAAGGVFGLGPGIWKQNIHPRQGPAGGPNSQGAFGLGLQKVDTALEAQALSLALGLVQTAL